LGFTIIDLGLLASAVARPGTTLFGADACPDLATKAAALLHSVARNHALLGGNKRAAWVLTRVMLLLNDVELGADELEVEEFMVAVAKDEKDLDSIAKWILDHIALRR
jgi:death-on-curing protein